jgi:hypothetical protein
MGKVVAAGLLSIVAVIVVFLPLHAPSSNQSQSMVPTIVAPADGAAVQAPVKVQIQYPGSGAALGGHIHLLIDVDPPKSGEVVPMDEQHRHLMNFETETVIDVTRTT